MHATVQANDLSAALKLSVASANSPMPALQHARLTTDDGQVHFETSDCEVYVRSTLPATIDAAGDLLLPEALLRPIAAGGGDIVIHGDGRVSRGRSRFQLGTRPADDFPSPDIVDFTQLAIDGADLRHAIAAVAYASDDQDVHTWAQPVHVQPGRVWAGDGKQFGRITVDYDGPAMAIPAAQVPRVMAALEAGGTLWAGNVRGGRAGMLRVKAPALMVTVNLLSVEPPDIERTLLSRIELPDAVAVLVRQPLMAALRRFMPFALWGGGKHTHRMVRLAAADGVLTLSDRDGQQHDVLEPGVVVGLVGDFEFAVDPKLLLESLGVIDAARVELFPPGPSTRTPCCLVLLPEGGDIDQVAHVLAPVQP